MLRLGKLELEYPFFQSPLSGYSDYAMRTIARDFGCPLSFSGVMLAKSAAHPKVLRKKEFQAYDDEHPVGAQIMGSSPDVMAAAATGLESAGFDIIDLNFACPAPKVLKRKRGGSLLSEPEKIMEIYKKVRDAVKCPVTVKLRIGIDNSEKSKDDFWEIIDGFSKELVDMVTIHGRTVTKLYRGKSDRKILAEIKRKYPAMLIAGSGDVFSAEDVKDLIENYGVDAVAVARGAVGNPWIFEEINAYFQGRENPEKPDIEQVRRVILRHFKLVCPLFKKERSTAYFRKFLTGYCKYHPQRKKTLLNLMKAKDIKQFKNCVNEFFTKNVGI